MATTDEVGAKKLEAFHERQGSNRPITRAMYGEAVYAAHKARGLALYFVYKTFKETYPELDVDGTMTKAIFQYGLYNSSCLKGCEDAADGLLMQSSLAGICAWDQTFVQVTVDRAEKHMKRCPLVDILREVGATPEEVTKFCRVILGAADIAMVEPYKDLIEVTFPKDLSTSDVCVMRIQKVKP